MTTIKVLICDLLFFFIRNPKDASLFLLNPLLVECYTSKSKQEEIIGQFDYALLQIAEFY